MKKDLFLLLMLGIIVITTIYPQSAKADSNPQKPKRQEKVFTTPEEDNLTLLRTGEINGVKCDHYIEGFRTLRFENGDFFTFEEGDKGEEDKEKLGAPSVGNWRKTLENGAVICYENQECITTVTFPNGLVLFTDHYDYGNHMYPQNIGYGNNWRNLIDLNVTRLKKYLQAGKYVAPSFVILPNTQDKIIYSEIDDGSFSLTKGFLIGNRIYQLTTDGMFVPTKQIVNGKGYFATQSDSIVKVVETQNNGFELIYANGDKMAFSDPDQKSPVQGTIHRNGGVLNIKTINGKTTWIFNYDNGDKFAGSLTWEDKGTKLLSYRDNLFFYNDLKPVTGTMIKADGSTVSLIDGRDEKEIEAEREMQKKAYDAKTKALYEEMCKKYGRNYVDAALARRPVIGMPEELLQKAFNLKLIEEGRSYKLYRITGLGWTNFGQTLSDSALLYSVWVMNGRVTNISYWGN